MLDGLTALAYGLGFAALGRSGHGGPTLLQRPLLPLPERPLPSHDSDPVP